MLSLSLKKPHTFHLGQVCGSFGKRQVLLERLRQMLIQDGQDPNTFVIELYCFERMVAKMETKTQSLEAKKVYRIKNIKCREPS